MIRSKILLIVLFFVCGFSSISFAYSEYYDISVDGNLFLDYSVFSYNEDLFITGDISLTADTVTIFSYEQEPMTPNLASLSIMLNPSINLYETGNILLFSDIPIINGSFEATGNLYIGNYSSLNQVPIQHSFFLMVSGLIGMVGFQKKIKTKSPYNCMQATAKRRA